MTYRVLEIFMAVITCSGVHDYMPFRAYVETNHHIYIYCS